MGNAVEQQVRPGRGSSPAFPSVAERIFDTADTDGSGDLSLIELKAAELKFRGSGDKVNERAANEMQADFQSIRNLDGKDQKDGISRSDLSNLRTNWKDISNESGMLRTFNEKKVGDLLAKVKPGGGAVTRDELERASTDTKAKLTPEQKAQLGYLVAHYDEINAQAQSKDGIAGSDIVNYGMRKSVELPDVIGMESRLKDAVVVKTVRVPVPVEVNRPTTNQPTNKSGNGQDSPKPETGQESGGWGAGAAAGAVQGAAGAAKRKP